MILCKFFAVLSILLGLILSVASLAILKEGANLRSSVNTRSAVDLVAIALHSFPLVIGMILIAASTAIIVRRNWGRLVHMWVIWIAVPIAAFLGLILTSAAYLCTDDCSYIDSTSGELLYAVYLLFILGHAILSTLHFRNAKVKADFV